MWRMFECLIIVNNQRCGRVGRSTTMASWFPYVSRRRFASEGVNDAWTVKTKAIGKDNSNNPYLIPNEWIAATVGRFLHLPVPPCALMRKHDRRTVMFASISFEGDTAPADVDPGVLWQHEPLLCTGILVLDILVANCDRHARNIKVDNPGKPKRIHVFDHDRALFYVHPQEGAKRLAELNGRLGVTGGSVSGDNRHCLIDHIDTVEHFPHWLERVESMPRAFIHDACQQVHGLGATKREIHKVIDFLDNRRKNIAKLILNHKNQFPAITDWQLFL